MRESKPPFLNGGFSFAWHKVQPRQKRRRSPSLLRALQITAGGRVGVELGSRGWLQAARETEMHLECRHSDQCQAAFLPRIGFSATPSAMIPPRAPRRCPRRRARARWPWRPLRPCRWSRRRTGGGRPIPRSSRRTRRLSSRWATSPAKECLHRAAAALEPAVGALLQVRAEGGGVKGKTRNGRWALRSRRLHLRRSCRSCRSSWC